MTIRPPWWSGGRVGLADVGSAGEVLRGAGPGPADRSSHRARGCGQLRGLPEGAGLIWRRMEGLWVSVA